MKKATYLFALLVAMSCQTKQPETTNETTGVAKDSVSQNPAAETGRMLLTGSDASLKMSGTDSCEIVYQDYTVATKSHQDATGEDIVVINNKTNAQATIKIKEAEGIQYFNGLVGNCALIDIGTGNVREMAIYDLQTNKVVTILKGIVNDASIKDRKLSYAILLSDNQVKALKLPTCSNADLEISGYTEAMTYDFTTKKSVSTQKYDCIK
jgi:hypothetical protein